MQLPSTPNVLQLAAPPPNPRLSPTLCLSRPHSPRAPAPALVHRPVKRAGAVFVRWGRSDCPSTANLVYTGMTAGKNEGHRGDGLNMLCLPEDPE